MTIEQRLDQLEKRNRRLTAALTLMALAICAMVTVAARSDKVRHFKTVYADRVIAKTAIETKRIMVTNDEGDVVIFLRSLSGNSGAITSHSFFVAEGPDARQGQFLTYMGREDGKGQISILNKGPNQVAVTMYADKNGNGVVEARNPKTFEGTRLTASGLER